MKSRLIHICLGVLLLAGNPASWADEATDLQTALDAFDAFELDRTVELLDAFDEQYGSNAITLHRRVRIASLRAQVDVAQPLAAECVERYPDEALCYEALGEATILEVLVGGNILEMLGAARGTRDAWERAVELDPDNPRSQLLLLAFYRQAPWIAGGSKSKARRVEKEVLRRNPGKGLEARGYNALYDEDFEAAVRWFGEAHAALPGDRDAHWNYASALSRAERYSEAVEAWSQLTEDYPQMWRAWLRRGYAAAAGKLDAELARSSIQHFLDNDHYAPPGTQAMAQVGMGMVHEQTGALEEARAAFRLALTLREDFEPATEACERVGC